MWKFQGFRPTIFYNSARATAAWRGSAAQACFYFLFRCFFCVFLDLLEVKQPGSARRMASLRLPSPPQQGCARAGLL